MWVETLTQTNETFRRIQTLQWILTALLPLLSSIPLNRFCHLTIIMQLQMPLPQMTQWVLEVGLQYNHPHSGSVKFGTKMIFRHSFRFQKNFKDTFLHGKPWLSSVSSLLFSRSVKLALESSTSNRDQTAQEPRPILITVFLRLPIFLPILPSWCKSSAILFSMCITFLARKTLMLTT